MDHSVGKIWMMKIRILVICRRGKFGRRKFQRNWKAKVLESRSGGPPFSRPRERCESTMAESMRGRIRFRNLRETRAKTWVCHCAKKCQLRIGGKTSEPKGGVGAVGDGSAGLDARRHWCVAGWTPKHGNLGERQLPLQFARRCQRTCGESKRRKLESLNPESAGSLERLDWISCGSRKSRKS